MNQKSISKKKISFNTRITIDEFPLARKSRGNSLSDNLRRSFRVSRVKADDSIKQFEGEETPDSE
jgi:hypothetical protein